MILPNRILFIGAHCDDIELFAGGLLARSCLEAQTVGLLVFSDHRGVVSDEAAAQARQELKTNLETLRATARAEVTDHSDQWLPACHGAFEARRGELYAAMERLRDQYDLVVTHDPHDTNQDHRQVALEAQRVFKAHATVLGGEFPNNDLGGFSPSVYVALSDAEAEAKVALVRRYQSQNFGGRPYLDESVTRALLRLRGSQIREPWAEAFSVITRTIIRSAR